MTAVAPPARAEEERAFFTALCALSASQDVSQAELADFVGVSQGYVSKIMAGKQFPKGHLRHRFAEFFGMKYADILTIGREREAGGGYGYPGPTEPRGGSVHEEAGGEGGRRAPLAPMEHNLLRSLLRDIKAREVHQLYYTEVPLREATGSMGGGSTETGARAVTYLSFRTEWIRSKGNPEYMSVIRAFGDSMSPTVTDGSVVLVDESRRHFVHNKVFYVRLSGQMYIKRLIERDGQALIVSDRDATEIPIRDGDDFEIIGRCVWMARDID